MNLKSVAALILAASAVPLASAGPLAYALCQTGQLLQPSLDVVLTTLQAATLLQSPVMPVPDSRLG